MAASKKNLVRGAINLYLGNGMGLVLSDDGEYLFVVPVCLLTGYSYVDSLSDKAYPPANISPRTFFEAVGFEESGWFSDDKEQEAMWLMKTKQIFSLVRSVRYSHFKRIVYHYDTKFHKYKDLGLTHIGINYLERLDLVKCIFRSGLSKEGDKENGWNGK